MKRNIFTILFTILLFCSSGTLAQISQVRGIVKSENGPLQGVSVIVKSTLAGTQTDSRGNFNIQANGNDTLVLSYSGFASQEISVGNRKELNVTLASDVKSIESVVVIGYGTKRKQYL